MVARIVTSLARTFDTLARARVRYPRCFNPPQGVLMNRLLIAPVALLIANLPLWAGDAIETAIEKLGAPRYVEREKAVRELETIGEPALKALRAAQASTDEEVRVRAKAVAARIERTILSRRLLEPPKIGFKFKNVPLDQALAEVWVKTGVKFAYSPGAGSDPQRHITVDISDRPFWEAIDAFLMATGLTESKAAPMPVVSAENMSRPIVRGVVNGRRLTSIRGGTPTAKDTLTLTDGTNSLPAFTDKSIRVRMVPTGTKFDAGKDELTLMLDVDPIPTLQVQDILGVEVRRVATDDRRLLAAAYPVPEMSADYQFAAAQFQQLVIVNGDIHASTGNMLDDRSFPVVLKAPGTRPRKLAEFEGIVFARVVVPSEPVITIDHVLAVETKGKVFQNDEWSMSVVSAEVAGPGRATVRVRIVASTTNDEMMFPVRVRGRVQPFLRINGAVRQAPDPRPDLRFRDEKGNALRMISNSIIRSEASVDGSFTREVEIRLELPTDRTPDVSLSFLERRAVTIEMPFKLKDVVIP